MDYITQCALGNAYRGALKDDDSAGTLTKQWPPTCQATPCVLLLSSLGRRS
jgi:hypothetical protein